MHGTRMPLRTWFWAAYLVSTCLERFAEARAVPAV
jgi:hypothetical protein